MSNNKLFGNLEVSNKTSRNGFDLSKRTYFSAKIGQLLPVYHRTLMVGDDIQVNVSHFTRTKPLQTAALTQIKEYFDWFFVPYRLLWKGSIPTLGGATNDKVEALSPYGSQNISDQLPQIPLNDILRTPAEATSTGKQAGVLATLLSRVDEFGFNRAFNCARLLEHLGYCQVSNDQLDNMFAETSTAASYLYLAYQPNVCLFPLLAYNKIYYDYLRNTNWEENVPHNYNVDYISADGMVNISTAINSATQEYWDNPTMFDLKYSTYPKDLFFGLLPDSQSGDESVVELSQDGSFANLQTITGSATTITASDGALQAGGSNLNTGSQNYLGVNLRDLETNFSILDLRRATFLQKYKEIVGSGNQNYSKVIQRVFGFDIPDEVTNLCQYLGGSTSVINISEETNSMLQGEIQPTIKGNGACTADGETIHFTCQEPGVLMCIYHAQPVIHYKLDAFHFDVVKTEVDDYANPVFDKLGYQALPHYFFCNNFVGRVNPNDHSTYYGELGYTSRYFDYKTDIDTVLTGFRSDLEHWLTPLDTQYLKEYIYGTGPNTQIRLNSTFFHVNPNIMNSIFFVNASDNYSTDHLQISASINCNAVRNLDYLGLPY